VPPSGRIYHVVPGPDSGAAAAMVIEVEADLVWAGLLLSFTVAVKLEVPVAVGVPEMVPVVAARLSPAGRLPELIDHVYEGFPPAAVIGAE
jgi:hypothetical protein